MAADNSTDDRDESTTNTADDVDAAEADDFEHDIDQDPVASDPSTWDGDSPPEGAVASKDDFEVQRDGDGELLPVWEAIPGSQKQKWVQVIPARQGDATRYLPDSGDPNDMEDRQIAEVLNRFFVEPSWDLDTSRAESELDDIKAFGITPLLLAWYNASGFEYQMGMVGENAELVQAVEGNTKTGN